MEEEKEGGWLVLPSPDLGRPSVVHFLDFVDTKIRIYRCHTNGKKFVHLATHLSSLSIFLTLRSLTRGHLFPLQLCFRRRPTMFSCLFFFFPSSFFPISLWPAAGSSLCLPQQSYCFTCPISLFYRRACRKLQF